MKISKRDQKLLLCAGGILIAVIAYFFGFRNLSSKNETLEYDNSQLANEVAELELLDARKEQYQADAEEMRRIIAEIVSQFPSEVREETAIMYAYEMENEADISVNSMSIQPKNRLYAMESTREAIIGRTEESGQAEEGQTDGTGDDGASLSLYTVTLSMDYTVSYTGFKDIVDYIQKDADKRNVESVTLSYDTETGNLLGSMVVNLFALQGNDRAYEEPYIPSVPIGNTNPFGTSGASGGQSGQDTGADEGTGENEADNGNGEEN